MPHKGAIKYERDRRRQKERERKRVRVKERERKKEEEERMQPKSWKTHSVLARESHFSS